MPCAGQYTGSTGTGSLCYPPVGAALVVCTFRHGLVDSGSPAVVDNLAVVDSSAVGSPAAVEGIPVGTAVEVGQLVSRKSGVLVLETFALWRVVEHLASGACEGLSSQTLAVRLLSWLDRCNFRYNPGGGET